MKILQPVISCILYILVVALLAIAGYMAYDAYTATHSGQTIPTNDIVTVSSETPSEQPPPNPSETPQYTVPTAHPRRITIESINVSSFVQKVDIDQTNSIAVPNNIYFTGWYVQSALPGEPGVTIVDGHVGGRYNKAVFSDLKHITEGAEISIQRGDYSTVQYKVAQKLEVLPEDNAAVFKKYLKTSNELHLITCHGAYISSQQTYDHRLIVVAELIQ